MLSQGRDMEYIASHYNMDLALARAIRLEGKTDQEKFKELGWGPRNWKWPITKKPDLIFFDPPYFDKKAGDYSEKSIFSFPREEYLKFFEDFFTLMKQHAKQTTRLAFINADWRDFQNKAALDETPEDSILTDDYMNILSKTGWQRTHIIQVPLSSERFDAGIVSAMQKKRILGVTSRYLIIARSS